MSSGTTSRAERLAEMSWLERAAYWDHVAKVHKLAGNERDETFARVNAGTCRLMAIEDEEVDGG